MSRFLCGATIVGWGAVVLYGQVASAQVGTTLPPRVEAPGAAGPAKNAAEVNALARDMSDRVRELGEAIAADRGKTPSDAVLVEDARELSQALDEFRQGQMTLPDALRRRQMYSGVDDSWHHLMAQLARAGTLTPRIDEAVKRVKEIDGRMHQLIGLNAYPALYYGDRASPGGMREIQRLARALVDRAEVLLSAVRTEMRGPTGTRLAEWVNSLVQSADLFHDGIDLNSRADDMTRNGFAGVSAAADTLGADLATLQLPNRVRSAWQSYKATESLMRQALKLPPRQAEQAQSVVAVNGRTPVLDLADRLIAQIDDFLVAITPDARNIAEGGYFIADARRLRGAAAAFRQEIPRAIDVGQLAYGYQDVDALWQVLARRTNRIAQGRTGANLQRLERIGQTVSEIHQLLGMPGVPATVGPFAAPG